MQTLIRLLLQQTLLLSNVHAKPCSGLPMLLSGSFNTLSMKAWMGGGCTGQPGAPSTRVMRSAQAPLADAQPLTTSTAFLARTFIMAVLRLLDLHLIVLKLQHGQAVHRSCPQGCATQPCCCAAAAFCL